MQHILLLLFSFDSQLQKVTQWQVQKPYTFFEWPRINALREWTIFRTHGLYVANTVIGKFVNVQAMTDCILLCEHHEQCLSGSYAKLNGNSPNDAQRNKRMRNICFLSGSMIRNVSKLYNITQTYYFELNCSKRELYYERSMYHGAAPTTCGVPAFNQPANHRFSFPGQKRIINGATAPPYSQPWLGQVLEDGRNICGISLISSQNPFQASTLWAITAAHCFVDTRKTRVRTYSFLFGVYDLRYHTPHMVFVRAKKIVIHPKYDLMFSYDITIVKFSSPVRFNYFVRPICLPSTYNIEKLTACRICGYGAADVVGTFYPNQPKCYSAKVDIENTLIINTGEIDRSASYSTSPHNRFKGVGFGDSGGPVACPVIDQAVLFGVVNAFTLATNARRPSFSHYMHVPFFLHWILDEISKIDDPPEVTVSPVRPLRNRNELLPGQICWPKFPKSCMPARNSI